MVRRRSNAHGRGYIDNTTARRWQMGNHGSGDIVRAPEVRVYKHVPIVISRSCQGEWRRIDSSTIEDLV